MMTNNLFVMRLREGEITVPDWQQLLSTRNVTFHSQDYVDKCGIRLEY